MCSTSRAGPGGRLATRRIERVDRQGLAATTRLDHGALGFTASSAAFQTFADLALQAGWLAEWNHRFGGTLLRGWVSAETSSAAAAVSKDPGCLPDAKKFPKFVAGQNCINCALYQGKPADKAGGCPLFGAKQEAGAGWCSAWAKKA